MENKGWFYGLYDLVLAVFILFQIIDFYFVFLSRSTGQNWITNLGNEFELYLKKKTWSDFGLKRYPINYFSKCFWMFLICWVKL